MASGSTKLVRWPWLVLAFAGAVSCGLFLALSLRGSNKSAAMASPAPPSPPGAPAPVSAPTMQPTAMPPSLKDVPPQPQAANIPTNRESEPDKKAAPDKPRDHSDRTPVDDAPKPNVPTHHATKTKKNPPPPGKATVPMSRTVAVDDVSKADGDAPGAPAKPQAVKNETPDSQRGLAAGEAPAEGRTKAKRGKSSGSGIGHGGKGHGHRLAPDALGGLNDSRAEASGEAPADEDESAPKGKSLAKLLPGHFSAKVPEHMLINESIRVRATVAEIKDEPQAQAILEAAPAGPGPSKVVGEDVMVGKLLRVELRGLAREFEILPITPAEQQLRAGHVAQWEWVVVPHEEGKHELSIVVTNLVDWSGRPIDLTIHSALVSVDVSTMQRLRGYASVVSSIFSGITGLLGAYMAVMRPFLRRRQERDDDDRSKDKDKSAGKGGGEGGKDEKSPDAPKSADALPEPNQPKPPENKSESSAPVVVAAATPASRPPD